MEDTAKKIIGFGAIAAGAYLALRKTDDKEEEFNTGNFGGLGSGENSSLEGEESGEGITPVNISFPSIDPLTIFRDNNSPSVSNTQSQTDVVEETSESKQPITTTKKESVISQPVSLLSQTYDKAGEALTIEPMTLKAGSTKRAIEGRSEKGQAWSLTDNSIANLKSYVGTPGNVVNEQVKKVKESIGIDNSLSQKGNTFSEYTASEKARSKSETSLLDKIKGVFISPAYETPKTIETGGNVVGKLTSPIIENITKAPSSWQRGTVSKSETFDPSNPSGAKETLLTSKKEATTEKVKVSLQEAASRNYDDMVSKASGSSGSSSKKLTTTKKTASSSSSSSGIKRQGGSGTGESKVKIVKKK